MAIGVSYEDFWYGDPELVRYAIAAEEIRQRNRVIADDLTAWNTGRYVMMAVGVVLSQAFNGRSNLKYPSEPLIGPELDEALAEQKRERELRKSRDSFLALANAMWQAKQGKKPPQQEYAEPMNPSGGA